MLGWRGGLVLAGILTAVNFEASAQFVQRSRLEEGSEEAFVAPPPKEEPKIPPETPLAAPSVTTEQVENPPARELKIVKIAEPLKRRVLDPLAVTRGFQVLASTHPQQRSFNDPDPKLTEQKWAAIVRIKINGAMILSFEFDDPLKDVARLGGHQFLFVVSSHDEGQTTGGWFRRLLQELPAAKLAPAEEEFIRSWQADRGFVQVSEEYAAKDGEAFVFAESMTPEEVSKLMRESTQVKEFRILGATEEECERRARMLLTLLDEGFSKTIQRELLRRRDANAGAFLAAQTKYQEMQTELKEHQKQLAALPASDIVDLLPGMRVELRTIEIELAANQAKLDVLAKLLNAKPTELSVERRKLAEDTQFLAQIERTALDVKRQKAAEVIANAETRKHLTKEINWAETSLPSDVSHIAAYRGYVADFDRSLLAHGPVTVVRNRIAIRPVEWVMGK